MKRVTPYGEDVLEDKIQDAEEKSAQSQRKMDELNLALDDYFDYRNQQFGTAYKNSSDRLLLSDSVRQDGLMRERLLQEMEQRIGAYFTEVGTDYTISSIEYDDSTRTWIVTADEWNDINYQYPGSDCVDRMGFGTRHVLKVTVTSGDLYCVLSDTFSEYEVNGARSTDYSEKEIILANSCYTEPHTPENELLSIGMSYNPANAVSYANQWAIYPNPAYSFYEDRDCANFVSQCLYAGGIPNTGTGYSTGWYQDSLAWVNVAQFDIFWQNHGIIRVNAGTFSNCLIGNPIYYLNPSGSITSGHLTICTGYNSVGVPCYNAHTANEANIPVTNLITNNQILYTLDFAHDYTMYVDYGSLLLHKKYCSVCNDMQLESHHWSNPYVYDNDNPTDLIGYRCVDCGAVKYE